MISLSTQRLRAAAVFALIFTGLASAAAQTPYPNRTITLVLPFAAGSGTDTTTRIISQHLVRHSASASSSTTSRALMA